jgi:hypothetical protein
MAGSPRSAVTSLIRFAPASSAAAATGALEVSIELGGGAHRLGAGAR